MPRAGGPLLRLLKRDVRWRISCAGVVLLATMVLLVNPAHRRNYTRSATPNSARELLRTSPTVPLIFEANAGQWEDGILFAARGHRSSFFFHNNGFEIVPSQSGADPVLFHFPEIPPGSPSVSGLSALATRNNYLLGSDSSRWITGVPNYEGVLYRGLWPGVDLRIYENQGELEQDFIVQPGADPGSIGIELAKAQWATIDDSGDLVFPTQTGEVRLASPLAYQVAGERKQIVKAEYELHDGQINFLVKHFDRSKELIIDPVVTYSSYLGGAGGDTAEGIAVDASGNTYVTGSTDSMDFPIASPLYGASGGADVFVLKLSPSGSLVYSTYLGGSGDESGRAVAVDDSGNVYVTGSTRSVNFPTTPQSFQTALHGTENAFITKLSASGSILIYSTYLGGNGVDLGWGIATDTGNQAYVAGTTNSSTFPTFAAFQGSRSPDDQEQFSCLPSPCSDAFVAKINAAGSALVYSTYLGGGATDAARAVAVDANGSAYVIGETSSTKFPVNSGALQTTLVGLTSAFVSRFDATGSLQFSTYLGGSQRDLGMAIAVDPQGNPYAAGHTRSTDFPLTTNAFQASNAGQYDVFVAKLDPSGTALLYSTYMGGDADDLARAIAIDDVGDIHLAGETSSSNFPIAGALQPYAGNIDAFILKMNTAGSTLKYSSYYGGSSDDRATAIGLDASGNAHVTGKTRSSDFPVTNALQADAAGNDEAFVLQIADAAPPASNTNADLSVNMTADRSTIESGQSISYTIKVVNKGPDAAVNVKLVDSIPETSQLVSALPAQGLCDAGPPLTCVLSILAVDQTTTITITLRNDGTAGAFVNTVRVSSDATDPSPVDNSATVSVFASFPASAPCFIATAAYGSYLDPHVQALRDFRDRYLMTTPAGRAFVHWYYSHSPPAARLIEEHDSLRWTVRIALTPLVFSVSDPLPTLGIGIAGLALLWFKVIRR